MRTDCQLSEFARLAAGRRGPDRRGAVTLWTVLSLPALLLVLFLVADSIHLWVARVELENALEAAALAAVKQWKGVGDTQFPRQVGLEYAAANTINGDPVDHTVGNMPLDDNYDNLTGGTNQNASCDGNLVFGGAEAIAGTPCLRYRFNAGASAGCVPAKVFINIIKTDSGTDSNPREFGVFYEDGPNYLSIQSVSITLPIVDAKNPNQYPFFDSTKVIAPSIGTPGADGVPITPPVIPPPYPWYNLNNGVSPNDIRGLSIPAIPPASWLCPFAVGSDICFTVSDAVPGLAGRYRTLTANFRQGTFQAPTDPSDSTTWEFMRFGGSINGMNPPAYPPGSQNDGEAFWQGGVTVTVVFYNSNTNTTVSVGGVFQNNGSTTDGYAYAQVGGGGGGGFYPAVRAQAAFPVPSLLCRLCGNVFGPYAVNACATAMYDCDTGRPRLIRVEAGDYACP